MTAQDNSNRPHAHVIWGMHGGYFLTNYDQMVEALCRAERCLKKHPGLVYNMEFEAYTLDRLARGPQLDVEAKCGDVPWQDQDYVARFRKAVAEGRMDNVSSYTQPILHAIDGEAVVRQFGYARRIQRETLGKELEYYATQEPCWCGQLPAILSGFDMKGCIYETSWGPFGFAPLKHGETFRWRGPDGSEIRTLPMQPYVRKPMPPPPNGKRQYDPWCNPWFLSANAKTVLAGRALGIEHPAIQCMSLDFTSGRPEEWFDPIRYAGDDADFTFTTLGPYLKIARDDGPWDDAFAEFTDRLCWAQNGGGQYLDSQVASNKTILAQRLSIIAGIDCQDEEDKMWQAVMISHHHDCWLCWTSIFGHWRHGYDAYADVTHACRLEVEDRSARAIPAPQSASFRLANPTQRERREWTAIDIGLPAGALKEGAGVTDTDGKSAPSRLTVPERHPDGSAARVTGCMLAEVDGFSAARYTLSENADEATLPVEVKAAEDDQYELSNDHLRVVLSKDGIRLFRGDEQVLSGIGLHAVVNGWDTRGQIREVSACLSETGAARAEATGLVGCIPFVLALELKPWSDALDIHVTCDYDGERTESANYWELDGNMKLVLEYAKSARHLLQHPLELRAPAAGIHSAVHYVLAEWEDGGGFATIIDRPSGVVTAECATSIVLCHSGWHIVGTPDRAGVRADSSRFANDIVHGTREYDVRVMPYSPEEKAGAVWAYQRQAYPLTAVADADGPLPVPGVTVTGHSVVSGFCREADAFVLRLWNPLEEETLRVEAPGMVISSTNLEGRHAEELGTGSAAVTVRPMQILTLRLTQKSA